MIDASIVFTIRDGQTHELLYYGQVDILINEEESEDE